jgi:hypothetical protein
MKRLLLLVAAMFSGCGTESPKKEIHNRYIPVPVYVQPSIQPGDCIASDERTSYVVISVGDSGITIKKLLRTPLFSCINPLYTLSYDQLSFYRKVLCPMNKFY